MSTRHSHRRINVSQLFKSPESPFKQSGHNARNLADIVIYFSKHRGSALGDLQISALHRFHTQPDFDLREHISFSTSEVISAYFRLFDDLFFFGSLRDRCNLAIDRDERDKPGGEESLVTGSRGQKIVGREVKITKTVFGFVEKTVGEQRYVIVLNSPQKEFAGRYTMMKAYVGTLLHGMCHAFLELWTCDHRGCMEGFEKLGKTRHGVVWQDVALAIEDAVRDRRFLNLDLHLNREVGLALEVNDADEEVGGPHLERWRMDYGDMVEAGRIVRARKEGEDDCRIVAEKSGATKKLSLAARFAKGMDLLQRGLFK